MQDTFIADNVSTVKLSNLQWLELIDALDEHISEVRYTAQRADVADKLTVLVDALYSQLKNGPVPDIDEMELTDKVELLRKGELPPLSDIPTLD